jgi:protein-S-isoprenylcysteine O-methyltransferase Ste14
MTSRAADVTAGGATRGVSIAGLLMMGGGVAGLLTTRTFLATAPTAIVAQAAAAALMVWARLTFGRRSFHAAADPTEGGLVTSGPYHFIRHPIYTAVCLFCWAAVLSHLSIETLLLGGAVIAGTLLRIFMEEKLLLQRYPAYREYALVTKRMVPYVF